jgi:hypothetical protein
MALLHPNVLRKAMEVLHQMVVDFREVEDPHDKCCKFLESHLNQV